MAERSRVTRDYQSAREFKHVTLRTLGLARCLIPPPIMMAVAPMLLGLPISFNNKHSGHCLTSTDTVSCITIIWISYAGSSLCNYIVRCDSIIRPLPVLS